jgi:type 1 glutamine amidotransferase
MWQEISGQEKEVFLEEFEKGTGIVFLHHSLCSHQEWSGYEQLVGGKYHMPEYTADSNLISDYRHDISLHVEILDTQHPVTSGITNFDIMDEGYSHTSRLPGTHPLLKTDHPDCDSIIGWAHEVMNSRVVYLMGGHDRHAYENESFRKLVSNAINWTSAQE